MELLTFYPSAAENGIRRGQTNTVKETLHCPGTLGKASYRYFSEQAYSFPMQ